MQAVILTAGNSSRFAPFNTTHKSLWQIMGKSIIEYTVDSLRDAGVTEIIIVCKDEAAFRSIFEQEAYRDISIIYRIQSEAKGMGDALLQAKDAITSDFFVLSAHRFDINSFTHPMIEKKSEGASIVLLSQHTDDVSEFGSVSLKGDRVLDLIEKPRDVSTKEGFRLLSTYLLNVDFLGELENTEAGHYQFETAISNFCKKHDVRTLIVENESYSLKYPWDIFNLRDALFNKKNTSSSGSVKVSPTAQLIGDVILGENVQVMEYAVIKGPCYIGNNSIIGDHALIRNGSVLENDCVIAAGAEIKNSVIAAGSHVHGYIGDSVIGRNARIGFGFCSSNVRLDRGEVFVHVADKKVGTHRKNMGAIIGDDVKIGTNVSTMPGVVIGNNAIIGPSTMVKENIEDNNLFYTEFSYTKKLLGSNS